MNTNVDITARPKSASSVSATAAECRAGQPTRYGGVVAAMVTPCKSPGVVDPTAMANLARTLSAHGCDGLFVAASTGESVLLDEDDRRALTVAAREAADPKTLIYAGVSGMGLKQTIRYANYAAADGADVAVIMAPLFFKVAQRELVDYLLAVAEGSKLPVALYHHPRMATPLDVATVARVAEHPNIVAIKDTSQNIDRFQSLVEATSELQISLLQGNESLLQQSLSLGADGMVTALAGVVPEWHVQLLKAVRAGDPVAATHWYGRIYELWKMFCFEAVSASISNFAYSLKYALNMRGWLQQLHGMLAGASSDADFERLIRDHLVATGVPSHGATGTRVDSAHGLSGVSHDSSHELKGGRNAVA